MKLTPLSLAVTLSLTSLISLNVQALELKALIVYDSSIINHPNSSYEQAREGLKQLLEEDGYTVAMFDNIDNDFGQNSETAELSQYQSIFDFNYSPLEPQTPDIFAAYKNYLNGNYGGILIVTEQPSADMVDLDEDGVFELGAIGLRNQEVVKFLNEDLGAGGVSKVSDAIDEAEPTSYDEQQTDLQSPNSIDKVIFDVPALFTDAGNGHFIIYKNKAENKGTGISFDGNSGELSNVSGGNLMVIGDINTFKYGTNNAFLSNVVQSNVLDSDNDGVPDVVEQEDGTDPKDPTDFTDSDGGGAPDYIETELFDPATDPTLPEENEYCAYQSLLKDSDHDGVSDANEAIYNTDPNDISDYLDTDGDLVPDDIEKCLNMTDPEDITSFFDFDQGGVPDYVEEVLHGTNPDDASDDDLGSYYSQLPDTDTDGDLVPDAVENIQGTDPNNIDSFLDTDGGGVPDYYEMTHNTEWLKTPTDDDLEGYLKARGAKKALKGSGGSTGWLTIMLLGLLTTLRLRRQNKSTHYLPK